MAMSASSMPVFQSNALKRQYDKEAKYARIVVKSIQD